MPYELYNTGINCEPSDKQLAELFGNRGDMFLTKTPAKLMSQRGYGNIPRRKVEKPADDVNITYPDYKLHSGTFHNVFTDFPKGPGGVGPNPMWADGTYEEMKVNFTKQADEQNDVRHLIPDLETEQRIKRYDLATFTGGTAQQNKLDFAMREAFDEVQRIKDKQRIDEIMAKFPISYERAFEIVREENVRQLARGMNISEAGIEAVLRAEPTQDNLDMLLARPDARQGHFVARANILGMGHMLGENGAGIYRPPPSGVVPGASSLGTIPGVGSGARPIPAFGDAGGGGGGGGVRPREFQHWRDTSRSISSAPSYNPAVGAREGARSDNYIPAGFPESWEQFNARMKRMNSRPPLNFSFTRGPQVAIDVEPLPNYMARRTVAGRNAHRRYVGSGADERSYYYQNQ